MGQRIYRSKRMNRYHEHDGLWWFALRKSMQNPPPDGAMEVIDHRGFIWGNCNGMCFVPLESVEITDALACSRAELGPVILARKGTIGLPGDFVHLWGVHDLVAIVAGPQIVTVDDYRLATPDELRAVGIEL